MGDETSTLVKLLFGVFTQLKFLKMKFRLNVYGMYSNVSECFLPQLQKQGKY